MFRDLLKKRKEKITFFHWHCLLCGSVIMKSVLAFRQKKYISVYTTEQNVCMAMMLWSSSPHFYVLSHSDWSKVKWLSNRIFTVKIGNAVNECEKLNNILDSRWWFSSSVEWNNLIKYSFIEKSWRGGTS